MSQKQTQQGYNTRLETIDEALASLPLAMPDLSEEVATNADLVQQCITALQGRVLPGPAKYVWKRSECVNDVIITFPQTNTVSGEVIITNSYGTPLTTEELNGFYFADSSKSYAFTADGSSIGVVYTLNSNTYNYTATYDANGLLTASGAIFDPTMIITTTSYGEYITPIYAFKDYQVSDSINAYPDGGMFEGHWYERFAIDPALFGCSKVAVDTFVYTSDTYTTQSTLNHSLGEVPKFVFVVANKAISASSGRYIASAVVVMVGGNGTASLEYVNSGTIIHTHSTSGTSGNKNTISPDFKPTSNTAYFEANTPYTLITMA